MKYRLLLSPRFLFFYMVLSLAVPNVALCFTENTPLMVDVVGVLLPLSLYARCCSVQLRTKTDVEVGNLSSQSL